MNNAFVIKHFLVELGVRCDSQTNFKTKNQPQTTKKKRQGNADAATTSHGLNNL